MRATSALGMVVLGLTTSFAAFDWLMSLDPHWISTIFGVYFWAGSLLSSLAATDLDSCSGFAAPVGWARRSPSSTCTTWESCSSAS